MLSKIYGRRIKSNEEIFVQISYVNGRLIHFVVTCVSELGSRTSGRHKREHIRRVTNANWFQLYCDAKNVGRLDEQR